MLVHIMVFIEYLNGQHFFKFQFNIILWLGLELPVYFRDEQILKPNFNNKILGKLHETMHFSMDAVTALRTFKITKIFLTAILSLVSFKLKIPVNMYVLLLSLNLWKFRMKCSETISVTIICIFLSRLFLCLLLSNDKFYIQSDGSLEY